MCYRKTRLGVLVNALSDQKRCGGGFNGTLVTATAWWLKHKSRTDTRSWHCHIHILVCLTALPQDAVKDVMVFWWQRGVGELGILHNKPGRCVKCVLNGPFPFLMTVACIKTNGTNMQRATDTKPVTTGGTCWSEKSGLANGLLSGSVLSSNSVPGSHLREKGLRIERSIRPKRVNEHNWDCQNKSQCICKS